LCWPTICLFLVEADKVGEHRWSKRLIWLNNNILLNKFNHIFPCGSKKFYNFSFWCLETRSHSVVQTKPSCLNLSSARDYRRVSLCLEGIYHLGQSSL
jgi:hypothetical protein